MKWLIDEMLPPAIADQLNGVGHDAVGVVAAGLAEADDAAVYAQQSTVAGSW